MMNVAALVVAVIAGAIAAISGFGIGSLLTPLLAVHYGTRLAVAIVSIPHLVATTVRFIGLREQLDRRVFLNFGILSAAGGLARSAAECPCRESRAGHRLWLPAGLRGRVRPDRVY